MRRARSMVLAAWLLIVVCGAGVAHGAQAVGTTVYLQTVDVATGQKITTACYTILNASIEGCDENGDGLIRFQDVAQGTFMVTQTKRAPGYLPVGDFPVTIGLSGDEQYVIIGLASAAGVRQTEADVSVAPIERETLSLIPGGCFIFYGGSIEGCDENGDGQVDFHGVPVGTYLLIQTQPIAGYQTMDHVWAVVKADRVILVSLQPTGVPSGGTTTIAIVTRDPESGDLLRGACYVVNDASIEGCDENGDGQVDYRGIATGTFTVTQTKAPAGYRLVPDFEITITGERNQVFLVRQGGTSPGMVDVSLVAVDALTRERIADAATCFVLVGGSEEGCDTNADGQVDYLGVVPGAYAVDVTGVPAGYVAYRGPLSVDVVPSVGGVQTFYIPFLPIAD